MQKIKTYIARIILLKFYADVTSHSRVIVHVLFLEHLRYFRFWNFKIQKYVYQLIANFILNSVESKFLNFITTPTQKFDKIWFWTNDFSASLLWVIAMTHMHRLLWIYIFCDVICHNNESEKFQLFWLIFMSHNICP